MKQPEESRADSFRTFILEPDNAKATFRWAESHYALGLTATAISILEEGEFCHFL